MMLPFTPLVPVGLRRTLSLLALCLAISVSTSYAQAVFTYTGGTHSWTDAASWQKSGDPTTANYPGDAGTGSNVHDVVMMPGVLTLSTDIDSLVHNLTFEGGRLVVANGNTLVLTGYVADSASSAIRMAGASSLQVKGGVRMDSLSFPGSGNLFVGGNLTVPHILVSPGTGPNSEIIFNGTGNQRFDYGASLQKIRIANTSGIVSLGGSLVVAQSTAIPAGAELRLGTTTGHSLGTVVGSGTISLSGTAGGNALWPGGNFSAFLGANAGKVVYYGDVSYTLSSVPVNGFNNLEFRGRGNRSLGLPLTVKGDLTIQDQDTLTLSSTNTVTLSGGDMIVNGRFDGGESSTVRFTSTAADQNLGGTGAASFADVILAKAGTNLVLGMPISIFGDLNFNTAGNLVQGPYDITLGPATLVRANGTFGPNTMIEQDGSAGSGYLIKEGSAAGQFIQARITTQFVYPIGSNGHYTPAQITSLDATVTDTATIAIKTVPLTAGNDVLRRIWRIRTTNLSAINDARLQFGFTGDEVVGTPNTVTRQQGGTYYAATGGFYSGLTGSQTFGVNAAGNTFLEESWGLSKAGSLPRAYYSYQSGEWDSPATWTTDPSGSVQINMPEAGGPDANDVAIILPGHTVHMQSGPKSLNSVVINEEGVLDLDTTHGHTLGNLSGKGTLRLARLSLPNASYEAFVSSTGGTVEYYNVTGNLPTSQTTYNNLSLADSGTKTFSANGGARTYRIRGNLDVKGGKAVIGNNSTRLWLAVGKNVSVAANASLSAGNAGSHQLDIAGNLTNDGTLTLTHRTPPMIAAYQSSNATDGYVKVRFLGSSNNTLNANGPSNFYGIEVQKGSDPTFTLSINTTDSANFNLLGPISGGDSGSANFINTRSYQALATRYGTIVLGPRIKINGLTTSQWRVNAGAGLVIDGARVNLLFDNNGGGSGKAFLIYGRFTMRNGYLNTGVTEGLVTRGAGEYIQSGGYVRTTRFRPSVITSTIPRSLFDMSGGTLDCYGASFANSFYGTFSSPYPNNVFRMSGGTINIYSANNGGPSANTALQIGCDPGNTTVSGGTVNFYLPAANRTTNNDFGVTSTAPLYNVNVFSDRTDTADVATTLSLRDMRYGDENGNYTFPTRDLVILNNLTLNDHAYVRSLNGAGIRVGGNATFAATSRYDVGTSRFTMGNTPLMMAAQTLTLGRPMTFGKLSIANTRSTGTVTLAGADLSLTDTLSIELGTLNDGGLTIRTQGTVLNSATHAGSGALVLTGGRAAGVQTIGGNGNGSFANITFASADSARRSFAFASNQKITGTMTLRNGLVNLRSYNLLIKRTATLVTFDTITLTRGLTSDGISTDGGVTTEFRNAAGYDLPFVHGGQMRNVISSAVDPNPGQMTIVPVVGTHPSITAPPATTNDALKFYWRVRSSGFSPQLSSSMFAVIYPDADLPLGAGSDSAYVIGLYNGHDWATAPFNGADVNGLVHFSDTAINRDITVGNAIAFGGSFTYESIASGEWSTPATWKKTQNGADVENPATTVPSSTSPIIIHNGDAVHVTTAAGSIDVPSLRIDSGAVLDLDTTRGHNFHVVYAGLPSNGTLKLSSALATAQFPAGDFERFLGTDGGTVHYYTSGTDYTLPTLSHYRNLVLEHGGNIITTPSADVTVSENTSVLGSSAGHVQLGAGAAGDLMVGKNLSIDAGAAVNYDGAGATRLLSVDGNVLNSGTLIVAGTGSAVHALSIGGSLTNAGTLDLQPGAANAMRVNTTFRGASDARIEGAGATTRFSQIVVDKGTGTTALLDVTAANFQLLGDASGASKPLELRNGTFKLSTDANLTVSSGASAAMFQIPATATLWVAQGKVALNATGTNAGMQLDGTLKLSGNGVVKLVGNASSDNSIQYGSAGTPSIDMAGDSLIVGGQIRGNARAASGSLVYRQTRGEVLVGMQNAATSIKPMFEVVNQGNLLLSGGRITIARSRGNATVADVLLQPAGYTVTGGTVQLGMPGVTVPGTTFSLNTSVPMANLTVGTPGLLTNASIYTNPLQVQGTLTVEDSATLISNGRDLRLGGDLVLNGRYLPAGNTTQFNGAIGNQTVSGTGTFSFDDLEVRNTAANGKVILAGQDWTVAGDLNLASGTLDGNTRFITVQGNVTNSAAHTSTTGSLVLAGAQSQRIGGNGSGAFGSLQINNAGGVAADAAMQVNGELNLVNGLLDIQANRLTLGTQSTVTGTFSASRMIRTSGSSGDAGVVLLRNAGGFDFSLPIGSENHYTPARYQADGAAPAGSITVRPVNRAHPLLTTFTQQGLAYYWAVTNSGLGSTAVTQTYTYDQASADGHGNENNYIGAHLTIAPQWEAFPGVVDPAANTLTFTTLPPIGEFTAGEDSVFAPIVPFRSAQTGAWEDTLTWINHEVPAPGSVVILRADHAVTINLDNVNVARTLIGDSARLDVGSTVGHNLGDITGRGTLSTATGTLPAGSYGLFTDFDGGTIEFTGSGHALPAGRSVYNNLTINNPAMGTITTRNSLLTINGNLHMQSGILSNQANRRVIVHGNLSTTNMGGYIAGTAASTEFLELQGDLMVSGSFETGGTTVLFDGDSIQTIGGGVRFIDMSSLQVSKLTGYVNVLTGVNLANQLFLDQGLIRLQNGDLTLAADALVKPDVITPASYVWASETGRMIRKIVTAPMPLSNSYTLLPLGDSAKYLPFTFRLKQGDIDPVNGGSVAMNLVMAPHPQRGAAARYLKHYYTLEPQNITGTVLYDVRYRISSPDDIQVDSVNDVRPFLPAKYSANTWEYGGAYDSTQLLFTWSNIDSFSDFTAGSGLGDTLPDAVQPVLRQGLSTVYVVPNPGQAGQQHLLLKGFTGSRVRALVVDMKGQIHVNEHLTLTPDGEAKVDAMNMLSPGLYQLIIEQNGNRRSCRFVVQ